MADIDTLNHHTLKGGEGGYMRGRFRVLWPASHYLGLSTYRIVSGVCVCEHVCVRQGGGVIDGSNHQQCPTT